MKTLALFALVAALGMGTASMLRTDNHDHVLSPDQNVNGAFRDGLYLGKLAAERGAEPHVAMGRWVTSEDRSSFTAGYQQGYSGSLAGRADSRARRTE